MALEGSGDSQYGIVLVTSVALRESGLQFFCSSYSCVHKSTVFLERNPVKCLNSAGRLSSLPVVKKKKAEPFAPE